MGISCFPSFRAFLVVLLLLSGCAAKTDGPPAFDGERAFGMLKKQCDFGPRYAGTPGHKATADWIKSQLLDQADLVAPRVFEHNVRGKSLQFENIYAVFNPRAKRFVLLCTHWDTRTVADEEVDRAKRTKPILGANDGASGVAVLLELARAFHEKKPEVGIIMAFFDGEDYGPGEMDMYIGSEEFAKNKNWERLLDSFHIRPSSLEYGILLDMVGKKDLRIPKEKFSVQAAPKIVEKVWSAARAAGHGDVFVDEEGTMIRDDHVPLLEAGIKCIDVIDFNYGPWHTLDDTPDKCSAKSLQVVGEVIEKVVY